MALARAINPLFLFKRRLGISNCVCQRQNKQNFDSSQLPIRTTPQPVSLLMTAAISLDTSFKNCSHLDTITWEMGSKLKISKLPFNFLLCTVSYFGNSLYKFAETVNQWLRWCFEIIWLFKKKTHTHTPVDKTPIC